MWSLQGLEKNKLTQTCSNSIPWSSLRFISVVLMENSFLQTQSDRFIGVISKMYKGSLIYNKICKAMEEQFKEYLWAQCCIFVLHWGLGFLCLRPIMQYLSFATRIYKLQRSLLLLLAAILGATNFKWCPPSLPSQQRVLPAVVVPLPQCLDLPSPSTET